VRSRSASRRMSDSVKNCIEYPSVSVTPPCATHLRQALLPYGLKAQHAGSSQVITGMRISGGCRRTETIKAADGVRRSRALTRRVGQRAPHRFDRGTAATGPCPTWAMRPHAQMRRATPERARCPPGGASQHQ
jgi:hypothetical protein